MKVRIIVKITHQPPIDTPASISYETIDIDSEELQKSIECPDNNYSYGTVIGAEVLEND